jgi:AcrR family transcriptional regulator
MQKEKRTNQARSEAMRAALLDAAQPLFVRAGFVGTSTPEIVAAAQATRGALYHHFVDKKDLFRAVVQREAEAVAKSIRSTAVADDAQTALRQGAEAYFEAMSVPGRARLLLVEGPAALGTEAMDALDRLTGRDTLRDGLAYAVERGEAAPMPLDEMAAILSAAFDKAALAIAAGDAADLYKSAVSRLIDGLLTKAL